MAARATCTGASSCSTSAAGTPCRSASSPTSRRPSSPAARPTRGRVGVAARSCGGGTARSTWEQPTVSWVSSLCSCTSRRWSRTRARSACSWTRCGGSWSRSAPRGTGRPYGAAATITWCTSATVRRERCTSSARPTRCLATRCTSARPRRPGSWSGATGCSARAPASATALRAMATSSWRSSAPAAARGGCAAPATTAPSCSSPTSSASAARRTTPCRSSRALRARDASSWTSGSRLRPARCPSSRWAG
mmetsp:Transcript_82620/g.260931  ORF Transcript_82620/g.260931 Transcript_82620/m.260931 type:complete len:250 (-) Transcript_82620:1437-2186(-)